MPLDRRQLLGGLAATGAAALVGCGDDDGSGSSASSPTTPSPTSSGTTSSGSPSTTQASPRPRFDRVVASGLNVPWEIAFLDSGDALVPERDTARIVRVTPNGKTSGLGEVPDVDTRAEGSSGEGGLLGIALAPDERDLFAYLSTTSDNRVVRMRLREGRLGSPRNVLTGIPRSVHHNGGRIVFGPDGLLYVSTGDAEDSSNSQDRESRGGKILRITPGGKQAPDNPFDNEVFSYGHRNVEGLAFDADDRLWASEFGASETDELNLVQAGENYGWPQVEGRGGDDDLVDPKVTWGTSECSPAGVAIARSTAFVGALQGECVFSVALSGTKTSEPERLLGDEYGRLRTPVAAPDGALWVTTSNTDGRADPGPKDDRILRVTLD